MLNILIAAAVFALLTSLLLHALFLWLLCRLFGVRRPLAGGDAAPIRYRRALGVVCLIALFNVAVAAVAFWSLRQESLPMLIGILVGYLVGLMLLLRWGLASGAGKAILLTMAWLVFDIGYGVVLSGLVLVTVASFFTQPTGNMAETVLGYHKDVHCPSCGLAFAVNASQEIDPPAGQPPVHVGGCTCPNCRQQIHFAGARGGMEREPSSVQVPDPGPGSPDHFMVLHNAIAAHVAPLQRFDLVTFHYPVTQPGSPSVSYLKRLIGLPGETIAIHSGNLYLLDADDSPSHRKTEASEKERPDMHVDEALPAWKEHKFVILRKSPEQILPLMRLVYDNDHPAANQPARWKGEGWTSTQDNGFRHDGGSERMHWLRYEHLLRDSGGRPSLITDFLGYNTAANHRLPSENWVNDLILECEATVEKPEGELILELSRGVDRFRVRWDLGKGVCSLVRVRGDKEERLADGQAPLKEGAHQLRLANVDEQLVLWVDGRLPLGSTPYPAPDKEGARKANDLEPASIGVKGAGVEVRKLKLFRDVYYTTGGEGDGDRFFNPTTADVAGMDFTDPETWGPLAEAPMRTYWVAPGHYFFLGDNSQESSDSRSWGLVPEGHLLGKAVIVYYPWGRVRMLR